MTALIVILGVAVTVAALVGAAAWLDRPRGRHRLDGDKAAAHFRSLRETPALPAAARAGQAPEPGGYPVPPEEATTAPPGATWPGAGPGPDSPVPGPGRHPRQSWLYTVGYGPFERGPKAVIPSGRVSLRVTGELLAVPDRPRLVGGHVTDHDTWWDRPVNQP